MSKHYKKLLLILIPACAGFCLALALGSAEETSEPLTQKETARLVIGALWALSSHDVDRMYEYFDPNYVHYPPDYAWHRGNSLNLDETITWFFRGADDSSNLYLYTYTRQILIHHDRAVVYFHRWASIGGVPSMSRQLDNVKLSSEIWIWHIRDGKIFKGHSVSDDTPHEDYNKALVKEAILALMEDPNNYPFAGMTPRNYYVSGSRLLQGYWVSQFVDDEWSWLKQGEDLRFPSIIAEGDMVSVVLKWCVLPPGDYWGQLYSQLATFRISDGLIVEGWIAEPYGYSRNDR